MNDYELTIIDFDEIKHQTDNAWLLIIDKKEVWFPKSICQIDDPKENIICVPEWMAIEKGLV